MSAPRNGRDPAGPRFIDDVKAVADLPIEMLQEGMSALRGQPYALPLETTHLFEPLFGKPIAKAIGRFIALFAENTYDNDDPVGAARTVLNSLCDAEESVSPDLREALLQRVEVLAEPMGSLRTGMKARDLAYSTNDVITEPMFIVDARPVYDEGGTTIECYVEVVTLQVNVDGMTLHYNVPRNAITELSNQLERLRSKQQALKASVASSGVPLVYVQRK